MIMGVLPLSTVDWPGRISAVVFFAGCNLRCPWCQNPDCVTGTGNVELGDVFGVIDRSIPIIDSIVLSGGEPTLHPDACLEILRFAKERRIAGALETNGTRPEALSRILPLLDFVAIDVKAPLSDRELYSRVAGAPVDTARIAESLRTVSVSGVELEPRVTVVPGLNDSEQVIREISRNLAELGIPRIRLTQFRNERTLDPSFQNLLSPSREKLMELARVAAEGGMEVRIFTAERGLERIRRNG